MASRHEIAEGQNPLTTNPETMYKDIRELLTRNEWEISMGTERLVEVEKGCTVHCFDGRPAIEGTDPALLRGVRIPGGVYGVAALSRKINRRGPHRNLFFQACNVIATAGFIPVAHGDDKHKARGCGVVDLWLEGKFDGLQELPALPEYAEQLATLDPQRLLYLTLIGEHRERAMEIVLRQDMTRTPNGTAFQITPWASQLLGIDPSHMVFMAMDIVKQLGGARRAILYR